MTAEETATGAPTLPGRWRFRIGIALFTLWLIPYAILAPIVFHDWPLEAIAAVATAGVVFQKIAFVGAIAVLGKPGLLYLKRTLFSRLASLLPAAEVGPVRYRVGLVMFCLPFLEGWLETWASHIAPQIVANRLSVDVVANVMLVTSIFVLGGNFWDKLRALFIRDARALFPTEESQPASGAPLVSSTAQ